MKKIPSVYPKCDVLWTKKEYLDRIKEVEFLNLIKHEDFPKNWDSLAALSIILRNTNKLSNILDAGGEIYSVILPWLDSYGYNNLNCINLTFKKKEKKGNVIYEYGNIIKTRFENCHFEAITCLSVVEHGVDWKEYFKEMSRILKPGGILFTSIDYWKEPIDTKDYKYFGVPIRIFTSRDVINAINIAKKYNLHLLSPLKLNCKNKVICWKEFGLYYTFLYFTLKKIGK